MQGLLLAKGPGVMKGYYKDEASSAKAFKAGDGWFDTGDLGWRAPSESSVPPRALLFVPLLCCCIIPTCPSSLGLVLLKQP